MKELFLIFFLGDEGENFYIILKGEAYVFVPKPLKELTQDFTNDNKKLAFEDYMTYIRKSLTEEPLESTGNNPTSEKGTGTIRLRRATTSMYAPITSTSSSVQKVKENLVKDKIFNPDVKIYAGNPKGDLNFEEKLLILNEKISNPYFQHGIATYKKISILRTGDFFGELALLFNQPRTASVIASEDLHIVSLSNNNYKDIFDSEIKNLWKKIDFFKETFRDISSALVAKFCHLLEEKKFIHNDVIYKENDVADGIYIVRQGEVQVRFYRNFK